MRGLLPVLLVLCGSGLSLAQSTNSGDIRGTVMDQSGALIPGATVTVTNVATGVTKTLQSNQDGIYDTSSIVVGDYTVTITKDGFDKLVRGPVTVKVGFTTVNANLKIGATTTEVTVNTDVPLLQTETGDQTTVLESKTMDQLPQVGTPNWENFMILLPGATGAPGASQGATNPGQEVSTNGNLPYSNVLADGASTTLSHSQNANPAIFETVDELQVSLSSFSAQYGIGGMVVNQITKGGTNKFHGEAYDFIQNSFFNSAPRTVGGPQPVPFLRYHDFGGNVGGPVLKNKAFFFFDYDQILDHGAASNSTQTVPTTAIMGGDFSTETRTIYDPTTQTIAYDANGNPYPVRKSFLQEYGSNAIPSSLFDPVANAFQQIAYPTPSHHIPDGKFIPGTVNNLGLLQNNWYSSVPQSTPYRRYFGRFDYDITPKNRLTMSVTQSDTPVLYPSSVTFCPVNCQMGDVDNYNPQITDVWTINDHLINEARMGYTAQLNFYRDETLGAGYAAKLGWQFAKADTIPNIQFTNTYPYAWVSPQTNAAYKEHVYDPSDVVTMIRGKHILHFGGEMLIYQDNSTAWGNTNAGTFQFSGQYTQQWTLDAKGVAHPNTNTGVEYADLLLGLSNNWNASVTPEYGARLKSPQVFVQDDWKLRPNLTVNLGLRYQINHGWNEVHGNEDSFDASVLNPATGTLGAYWYGNTHANGRDALLANVYNTFLPRVGFNWQPHQDMTVRAGAGLYSYNWSLDNYGSGMGAPFGASGSISDQTNGIIPAVKLGGNGTECAQGTPTGACSGAGPALPYTQASSDPARFNGQNASFNLYHTPVPKIVQYNFAVQQQLGANYMFELSYVGSHGFNLSAPTDLNAVLAQNFSTNDTAYRPYAQYQSITGNIYNGISNYNSLQAQLNKRTSYGLAFSANYVWSHFLDDQDSSGWGSREGPQNWQIANDTSANYGNSNFDMRQSFKARVVYDLPVGRGKAFLNNNMIVDEVLGGWQVASTIVLASGQPFMVTVPTGTFSTVGASEQHDGSEYPNWNPGVSYKAAHQNAETWINPQAFTLPADGTFGNVARNSLIGPGYQSINLSAGKQFDIWENVKFQLRADASNVFNHTSLGNPGTLTLENPDANGVFQATQQSTQITGNSISGRSLQFTGKLTF